MLPSRKALSRSELLTLTGVDQGTMIFWLRHELIEPDGPREGRGKHLRFPYYEANIAAIMLQLREFGSNIDSLKGVAGIYRKAIAWAERHELSRDDVMVIAMFNNSVLSKYARKLRNSEPLDTEAYEKDVEAFRVSINGKYDLSDDLLHKALSIDFDEYLRYGTAFQEIMAQPLYPPVPYPTYFWRTADGWKRGDHEVGQLRASSEGAFATIAIDVIGMLSRVWGKQCVD